MEAKIYKYRYQDPASGEVHWYYGQGLKEKYVRSALETRLNLEQGTLSKGIDRIRSSERKKVALNKPETRYLYGKLKVPPKHKIENYTIPELMNTSGMDRNQVISVISNELNCPISTIHSLNDPTIKDCLKCSNDRILVKTHKLIKTTVTNREFTESGSVGYKSSNIIVDTLSRVDEMRKHIKMLLQRDYNLIIELNDSEEELSKFTSALAKSQSILKNPRNTSQSELSKHNKRVIDLPKVISELEEKIHNYKNQYYSTGFYINAFDTYQFNTYEEVTNEFESCYSQLKRRLKRRYLNNIPYDENASHGLTLEEMLDSFWVTGNNDYVRLNEN